MAGEQKRPTGPQIGVHTACRAAMSGMSAHSAGNDVGQLLGAYGTNTGSEDYLLDLKAPIQPFTTE